MTVLILGTNTNGNCMQAYDDKEIERAIAELNGKHGVRNILKCFKFQNEEVKEFFKANITEISQNIAGALLLDRLLGLMQKNGICINVFNGDSFKYFDTLNTLKVNMEASEVPIVIHATPIVNQKKNKKKIAVETAKRPPDIALFHELLHVLHRLTDEELFTNRSYDTNYYENGKDNDLLYKEYKKTLEGDLDGLFLNDEGVTDLEEIYTIMGRFSKKVEHAVDVLSENIYRLFKGAPLRFGHIYPQISDTPIEMQRKTVTDFYYHYIHIANIIKQRYNKLK